MLNSVINRIRGNCEFMGGGHAGLGRVQAQLEEVWDYERDIHTETGEYLDEYLELELSLYLGSTTRLIQRILRKAAHDA